MRKLFPFIACSLLLPMGWANALAQESPTVTPAQRLNLELVNNVSRYNIDTQQNEYTNTFRLTQPTTDYKLTAGMLKQGDNYITLHRYDDEANDIPFARINLSATTTTPQSEVIDMLDFYQDGEGAHPGSVTLTQADLGSESNWGTDGTNLIWQASGYAYISGAGGFTFTVPAGYSDAKMQFIIYNGTNVRGGYWAYNLNDEGWRVVARATAQNSSSFVITGLNSGDVISLYGVNSSQTNLYQSPDIELIGVVHLPSSYVPTIEVTPTLSNWDQNNNDWGTPSSLGGSTTYTPNDAIDLPSLGNVTDQFAEHTDNNGHSDYYNYKADLDANVIIPTNGETGLDFYASADFTACTTTNPSSGTLTGHNGWSFNGASVYMDDNNGIWAYIVFYGAIIFQMPETFLGNNVTVTVTSGPNLDNSDNNYTGILYVNDVLYTFTGSGTHSWTVPVSAGGIIEFKTDGQTYSTDIASIVISSGNGNAMSAPAQASNGEFTSLPRGLNVKTALPIEQSKKQREFKAIINDK